MLRDADEAIARVEEDVRLAQRRAQRFPQLQKAIDEVRATAISSRRDVSVDVDAGGIVRDLTISDAALDRGARELSQEILELIEKARATARSQTMALTSEIMGDDDPIVKAIAADLDAQETGSHDWRTGSGR